MLAARPRICKVLGLALACTAMAACPIQLSTVSSCSSLCLISSRPTATAPPAAAVAPAIIPAATAIPATTPIPAAAAASAAPAALCGAGACVAYACGPWWGWGAIECLLDELCAAEVRGDDVVLKRLVLRCKTKTRRSVYWYSCPGVLSEKQLRGEATWVCAVLVLVVPVYGVVRWWGVTPCLISKLLYAAEVKGDDIVL